MASARNVLTDHFGNVAGTDSKVTVNGAEYGLSKTKLQGATDKMNETLDKLKFVYDGPAPGLYETGSNYTVLLKSWDELISEHIFDIIDKTLKIGVVPPSTLPEMNEYGFYYGIKYRHENSGGYIQFNADGTADFFGGDTEYETVQVKYSLNTVEVTQNIDYFYFAGGEIFNIRSDGLLLHTNNLGFYLKGYSTVGSFGSTQLAGDLVLPFDENIVHLSDFLYFNENIAGLFIPDNIISLDSDALLVGKLQIVEIGAGLVGPTDTQFIGGSRLSAIKVAEGNPLYSSIDGSLYSKDGTTLIQYPYAKTSEVLIIPDGVTEIIQSACYGNKHLKNVVIPDSVLTIGQYTFYDGHNIESIRVGKGITNIGFCAFERIDDLHIYIDKPKDSIAGAPWVTWEGSGTIHWSDQTETYEVAGV